MKGYDIFMYVGVSLSSWLVIDANFLNYMDTILSIVVKSLTAISLLCYFLLNWNDIIKRIKSIFTKTKKDEQGG